MPETNWTLPLVTDTGAPPSAMAMLLTDVIVLPAFSKVSFPNAVMTMGAFLVVVATSVVISATGLTVMATISISLSVPSLVVSVRLTEPL